MEVNLGTDDREEIVTAREEGGGVIPRAFLPRLQHSKCFNLLKPTGHVMHHQFNVQQLYALPTLYLCVLYLSENKQRLVPLTT